MKASYKIVFFGNERLSTGFSPQGAPTLQALLQHGYQIPLVVANYERASSRTARALEIQQIAAAHNIPVVLPDRLQDITDTLVKTQADAGVLVAYGKIIPQSIIDLFPHGIINIHPSLLPKYRGPTPIEQAILDGAPKTGVSLMKLTKAMDAGPIYAQSELHLLGSEDKLTLTSSLLGLGVSMLIKQLPHILDGTLKPRYQDESKVTYSRLLSKEDGTLEPSSQPAAHLERQVRAYAGWPKSRIKIFGHLPIVHKVRVASGPTDGHLVIPCQNHTYLEILQLTTPSGRIATGADFIRGYKK